MLRLGDQDAAIHAHYAHGLAEYHLDLAGILVESLGPLKGQRRRLDRCQIDKLPRGFADDLVGDDQNIAVEQRCLAELEAGDDQFEKIVAWVDFGNAIDAVDLDCGCAHVPVSRKRDMKSTSSETKLPRSSGVSRSKARPGNSTIAGSTPIRWASATWAAKLSTPN